VKESKPSGVGRVPPPSEELSVTQSADYYIAAYEEQYRRARRVAKKRSSGTATAVSILSGCTTVLGAGGAFFSSDLPSAIIAILVTTLSASVAALNAWNNHFHHRELWLQRSTVLAEISQLRRDFSMRTRLGRWNRHSDDWEAKTAMEKLDAILRRDLESWTQIQGSQRGDDAAGPH
jgi:hypothetical protein